MMGCIEPGLHWALGAGCGSGANLHINILSLKKVCFFRVFFDTSKKNLELRKAMEQNKALR
jgi:hypothetical protein